MTDEQKPQVVNIAQIEDKKPEAFISVDPDQPIKLKMLEYKGNKMGVFVCVCGNGEDGKGDFSKYLKSFIDIDAKGRHKRWKEWHLLCGKDKCRQSVNFNLIQEQYRLITK